MDLERSILVTTIFMKGLMEMENQMALGSTFGIVEVCIKDTLQMVWGMGKVEFTHSEKYRFMV